MGNEKDKFNIVHTPYSKGMNLYFRRPLYERALLAIKEGRFRIGFEDWFDTNVFYYPVKAYHSTKPTFRFNGKDYKYYINKCEAVTTERVIELPIAIDFYNSNKTGSFLEIGNTINTHAIYSFPHTVLDKYETVEGVINDDIVDFKPVGKFKLIISISTMEHVGFDEEPKDDTKLEKSMENILSMLDDDGKLLITVPVGYNPALDKYLKTTKLNKRYMVKTSVFNEWKEMGEEEALKHTYNSKYKRDNAIVILTN